MALDNDWGFENDIKGKLGTANVHGICMTTSCHWAKNCLKAGQPLTEPPAVDLNAAAAMHVIHTKQQIKIDQGGGDFVQRVDVWHQGYFKCLGMTGTLLYSGNGLNWHVTSSHGVYILTIYGTGGHTMAFARFPKRSVFFDPNYGQFSCGASVFSSFKKDVKARLLKYTSLHGDWFIYKVRS